VAAEVRGREHLAGGDRGRRVGNAVDADHLRLRETIRRGERFSDSHCHVVVRAHHRVDVGIALHDVLEHLHGGEPAVLARLRRQHFDAGVLLHRALEPALARLRGARRRNAVDMHDLAFAVHRLEQILAKLVFHHFVVGTDIAHDVHTLHPVVVIDDRDPRLGRLLDRRHQRLVVDRHEHERIRLLDDPVLDEPRLLLDVVRLRRRDVLDVDAEILRRLVGADAAALPERIGDVLHEERDRRRLAALRPCVALRGSERNGGCRRDERCFDETSAIHGVSSSS
jgi:hypothetical protein